MFRSAGRRRNRSRKCCEPLSAEVQILEKRQLPAATIAPVDELAETTERTDASAGIVFIGGYGAAQYQYGFEGTYD